MANKRIKDLPAATETTVGDILPIDGSTTRGITVENFLGVNLDAIKGLTSAADKGIQFTGDGTAATYDLTTAGKALLDDADASAQRTTLGLVIGTNVQAQDAGLQSIADLTTAADNLIYTTASDTYAVTTITTFGRALVDDDDASAARTTLELVPGTDVQAYNADLAAIAGLTSAANKVVYYTGAGSAALADLTSFGRSLIDDADASTARTTLGVVPGTDVQTYNARLADIAGITYAQGDLLYFNGTSLVNLGAGSSGQFLKTLGTGANPSWDTIPGGGDMLSSNNLSDVASADTSLDNLGGTAVGKAVFTATDAAAARTALEIQQGMSDAERQRFALDSIYLSKILESYRRSVSFLAVGYKGTTTAANALNTGSSSNYTVDPSGYVAPSVVATDTLATQTFGSNNAAWSGFAVRQLVPSSLLSIDGTTVRVVLTGPTSGNATVLSSVYIGHVGTAPNFDGNQVQLTFSGNAGVTLPVGGTVTSDNVNFTFDHTKDVIVSLGVTSGDFREKTSATGFTKYQKAASSGEAGNTSVTGYTTIASTLFAVTKISIISIANMTVVTVAQTADAAVANGRALIEFDNTATPTLNTDLTVEVTCNGGTNWAAATLSDVTSYSQDGRRVVETADTACTSGTSFAARIKTLNNKSVPIYGLTLSVH